MKTKYIPEDVDKLLENFKNNFVKLCAENSVTQNKLAKAIGCTHETISNYQLGTTYPNLKTLLKIAEYFKITLNELVDMPKITEPAKEEAEQEYFSKRIGLSVEAVEYLYELSNNYESDLEALNYLLEEDYSRLYGHNEEYDDDDGLYILSCLYDAIHTPPFNINNISSKLHEKLNYYKNDYYLDGNTDIPMGEYYIQMFNYKINHLIKDKLWKQKDIQKQAKAALRKRPLPDKGK